MLSASQYRHLEDLLPTVKEACLHALSSMNLFRACWEDPAPYHLAIIQSQQALGYLWTEVQVAGLAD